MNKPGFLKNPMPPAPAPPKGRTYCGSLAQAHHGAPWLFRLLHHKPEHVVIWITKGQGHVILGGVRHGVSANIALFVPAGTLFSLELSQHATALYLQTSTDADDAFPQMPLHMRVRDGFAQAEITHLMDAMAREHNHHRPLVKDALTAYAHLLAVWLKRQQEPLSSDPRNKPREVELVSRYAVAITRQFRSGATIQSLAADLDVTSAHLTRCSRRICGKSASEMLTERRLHAARLSLMAAKPSIRDISFGLGFRSPAYFTRFMRQHTGLSPIELRNSVKPVAPAAQV